ncbi:MAG: hypothetical protein JXR03_09030 [Cyclobacteriaceae bacterium]
MHKLFAQVSEITLLDQLKNGYENLIADTAKNLTYRPTIIYKDDNQYFKFLNIQYGISFNSKYPRSYNDGSVWKGKGITNELNGGVQLRTGLLYATFYPVIFHSGNASYHMKSINPDQNKFNYQFGVSRNIDFVQRYGDNSFTEFNLGQSELAFRTKHFHIAASTQNFTLGPSKYNGIIMSNGAPGFPHIVIGTPQKINLKIKNFDLGNAEINLYYGLLSESNYFDTISNNNKSYLNALSIGYEIPYIKGLSVGFQKVLYKNTQHFNINDIYSMFHRHDKGIILSQNGDTLVDTNDKFDQLASAHIEWKISNQDMRIYFEFARNDFNGTLRNLITEFEHSRAYSLGLEKAFKLKSGQNLHLSYEHTFLPRYLSYNYRPNPAFYTHNIVRQGYTNRGQLIGAGIGPGSVSDIFTSTWFRKNSYLGFMIQKIRFDEDYFITKIPNNLDKIKRHDVEYSLGLNYTLQKTNFIYGVNSTFSYRFNMFFEEGNDKINFGGNLFIRYIIKK